ncbi:MAG: helix-turn-helix domain-containing protein [Clostridiales bacterium]|nr:helix-turn-helix domain-containing protein [Clostridiales bacterium]
MKNRSNGTKIRIEKNRSYSAMSNYHLFDKNLSFKAKGLLPFMLCVPDTWEFSVKGLAAMAKDGIDSITTSLKELENSGYIERHRSRNEKGQVMGTEYIIYEKPIVNDGVPTDEPAGTICEITLSNYDSTDKEENFEQLVSDKHTKLCQSYAENYKHTEVISKEPFSETPIRENPVQGNTAQLNIKSNNILNEVNINSIYSSQEKKEDRYEMSRSLPTENKYLNYTDKVYEIKDNLNYDDVLKEQCAGSEIEIVDYMIDIMAQTMLSESRTIRIGGQNLPSAIVKEKFNDLWYEDIIYVLDRLNKAQTEVKNIKNYMLTALYNAPADSSFTAAENYINRNQSKIKQPSMYYELIV